MRCDRSITGQSSEGMVCAVSPERTRVEDSEHSTYHDRAVCWAFWCMAPMVHVSVLTVATNQRGHGCCAPPRSYSMRPKRYGSPIPGAYCNNHARATFSCGNRNCDSYSLRVWGRRAASNSERITARPTRSSAD